MKYLLILFIFCTQFLAAQNTEPLSDIQKKVYTFEEVQVKPEFSGGENKFNEFVIANLNQSISKKRNSISANFIVEMDGTISNIEVSKDGDLGKELKRILKLSPKWLPGEHEGYHVKTTVKYILKT